MNIAILLKEYPPNVIGGTETQTRKMAHALARSGHDVTIYTKSYPETEEQKEPFSLERVPTWHYSPFISTLTFVFFVTLTLLLRRNRHDVLQCMMIYPNGFVGFLVSKLTGLPYFAWIRGGDYYFMKDTPVKRWMIQHVLKDTTVLVQTEQIRADVEKEFEPKDLRILGNGVDIPDRTAEGDDIVFVGRLEHQKGVHVLLQSAAELPDSEHVLIVGDGSEREHLELMADELGVDASFVGSVQPASVPQYLRRGKVFVLPAVKGEGLPNALLEAMAAGLPVIATSTGGIVDSVEEGETGYIVPPGDINLLQDRLDRLCSDEELRTNMGRNGRRLVSQRFSWERIVNELETVYSSVTIG